MRSILLSLLPILMPASIGVPIGCGSLVAEAAQLDVEVKQFLEQNFAKEPLLRSVQVKSVQVVHVNGNQYRAIATLATRRGEQQLSVNVVYSIDGGGFMEVEALDMAALRLGQM